MTLVEFRQRAAFLHEPEDLSAAECFFDRSHEGEAAAEAEAEMEAGKQTVLDLTSVRCRLNNTTVFLAGMAVLKLLRMIW